MAKNELVNSELYKPNSHKARREAQEKELEDKVVEKVISGEVKSREQPLPKKVARTFFADDMANVKNYIFLDVLIPTIKEAISQIIKNGSDMLIFGDLRPGGSKNGRTNYNWISSGGSTSPRRTVSKKAQRDFREEVFETRADAEEALSQLNELIERYGTASVSDFYTLIGETPKYTDRKWGWTSLSGVGVNRAFGGGYIIDLPRAEALE